MQIDKTQCTRFFTFAELTLNLSHVRKGCRRSHYNIHEKKQLQIAICMALSLSDSQQSPLPANKAF